MISLEDLLKEFNLKQTFFDFEELARIENLYDKFVVGSDQV